MGVFELQHLVALRMIENCHNTGTSRKRSYSIFLFEASHCTQNFEEKKRKRCREVQQLVFTLEFLLKEVKRNKNIVGNETTACNFKHQQKWAADETMHR